MKNGYSRHMELRSVVVDNNIMEFWELIRNYGAANRFFKTGMGERDATMHIALYYVGVL